MPLDDLAKALEELGYPVDRSLSEQGAVVLTGFRINAGRYTGATVDIGIPYADFPFTPPAGVHIRPQLAPNGQNNINQSGLGADWQYWSRRLSAWSKDRTARHIISYINKVFLDA